MTVDAERPKLRPSRSMFDPGWATSRTGANIERDGRSFGRSASTVIRYGDAFVSGLRAGGVAATAKHFPGFGRARVNTDDATVAIRTPAATLRAVDERPFGAVRTDLVMVSSAI